MVATGGIVNDEFDVEAPVGVRVDRLVDGDRVVLFSRMVTIIGNRTHPDFARTRLLSIRALDGVSAVETLMPADWRVIPVDVQRTATVECLACDRSYDLRFNLAHGWPKPQTCPSCREGRPR